MTAHAFASTHHHGLTLTRIGLGNFRSIPVLVPPPAEQARIVTRVTELRRLCATLRERLQAQQATQSRLAEALVEQATA
jgi:type I restriction enzyme S subunit